jgi:hypothetical protein
MRSISMLRRRFWPFVLVVCILAASCQRSTAAPHEHVRTRVLFVGNSLTYYNELPRTVARIAASVGDTIHVAMAAAPNLALIDHLNGASDALDLLRMQKWDYVVLQQGPTTTPIGRDSLIIWTQMFDRHIRAAGAVPALFMVWPIGARWDRMPLVRESYSAAATSVRGIFLPAGDAWVAAHERDASLQLYGADDFHPAPLGTFLAALAIYERISGKDARTFPPHAFIGRNQLNLPESTIRVLQQASHAANSRSPNP